MRPKAAYRPQDPAAGIELEFASYVRHDSGVLLLKLHDGREIPFAVHQRVHRRSAR